MKKFITLVGLIFTVFFFKSNAQTTCNAEFAFQFINGNTVTFTPAMTDSVLTQHIWNFGDASPVSNQVVPTHSYAANGTYSVVHTVVLRTPNGTPVCTQSFTRVIVIQQAPPCNLVVDFSWMPATANPLTIVFQNLSTPLAATDSVLWSFGDGSSSLDVNPMHTYTNAGSYTVCLRVKKLTTPGTTPCVREICKTVIVQTDCNMVANFIWHPDSLNAQKIWFTNTTVPLGATDSIRWTFGDGTSSNVVHPNHTYTQPGTYTVCLRVQKRNNAGTPINCVREICHTIVIAPPPPACNLVVNYSWHADSLNNRKIYFTNLTNTTSTSAIVTWTFGDGTAANTWNAIHEYAQPGRYLVCLKVQTSNTCVRMICDSIVVGATPPPPCNNQSNFDFIRSTANSQTFAFFPAYQSNAAQYTWTFGDGTGSTNMLTNHTYAQAGMYNVCLTVWRNANCASTTCRTVQAGPTNNCDTAHVNYTFTRDVVMPNKVFFTAHSTMALIDQTWTITRVSNNQTIILHQNNPMYIFADTGYYRVCLRAVTVGGCVKEYCNYIRIEQIAPPNACVLQPYPNPATAMVNVNVNLSVPETITAKVYNTLNILVAERQIAGVAGNNVVSINIGTLPLGAYIIRVTHGNAVCYGTFQKM